MKLLMYRSLRTTILTNLMVDQQPSSNAFNRVAYSLLKGALGFQDILLLTVVLLLHQH